MTRNNQDRENNDDSLLNTEHILELATFALYDFTDLHI